MSYAQHECVSAYKKNIQVPVCPLCNKPVPVEKGILPDVAVGNHIDNYCQSDRAQERKKVKLYLLIQNIYEEYARIIYIVTGVYE